MTVALGTLTPTSTTVVDTRISTSPAAKALITLSFSAAFIPMFNHKVADPKGRGLPDGVPEEAIKAALESGEIAAVADGYFCARAQEWKCVDGKYYYNTGEHREAFGEELSSWDELVEEDGLIKFGSGMTMIKKD